MFSSVPAFRDELKARLESSLPSGWTVVKDLTAATVKLVPSVYIEFTGLSTTYLGAALTRGQVAAEATVVVVDPRTDDAKAEAGIEDELVPVLAELDKHSDIAWQSATKQRLDTGEFSWRITTLALVKL